MKSINTKVIEASIIDVVEVLTIKNDYPDLMPNRIVKEYWTFKGEYIGCIDPLTKFSSIIDAIEIGYQVKK